VVQILGVVDLSLKPYQLACIYKIQSDIERGQNRIFVNMPTGSGKIITILNYFKVYLEYEKRVLFLHSRTILLQQSSSCVSQLLSENQYVVELVNNINSFDIDGYDYLVLELEDFIKKEDLLENIYQEFKGIIIGLYSISSDNINAFVNRHGEISYSLKYSEGLFKFLQDSNMTELHKYQYDEDNIGDVDSVIDTNNIFFFNINKALENKNIKELICSIFCQKKTKYKDRQELITDIASLLSGFIPLGSIIGISFKHVYKTLTKYVFNKLGSELKCNICQ
jgi:hypothetical protein